MKIKLLYFRNLFFVIYQYLSPKIMGHKKQIVFCDFGKKDLKRPGYMIVRLLEKTGYKVFIKADLKKLLKTGVFGRAIFNSNCVKLTFRERLADLFIGERTGRSQKSLLLDFDLFQKAEERSKETTIFAPILFHPNFLKDEYFDKTLLLCENKNRPISLFFAGNFNQNQYDRDDTKTLFNILTRYEIINTIRSNLASGKIFEPSSLKELEDAILTDSVNGRFVLCNTSVFTIPPCKWFEILAKAQYFLSPPGVVQPFCHNTVESMSVGTVPLLQYPGIYYPELSKNQNCLTFDSEDELIDIVHEILNDKFSHDFQRMSKSARAYYSDFLSPESFKRKHDEFLNSSNTTGRIMICQNTLSTSLLKKRIIPHDQ